MRTKAQCAGNQAGAHSHTRIIILALAWLLAYAAFPAAGAAFTHPGLLNTLPELRFVKTRIRAGDQPWKQAFEALKADPLTSLDRPPHPRAYIECGGYNNPDRGCDDATYDAKAAYGLSLLWFFTDDKRYADKAIRYLDAWSAAFDSIGLSNAPLVSGWTLPSFANAGEILRYTDAGWSGPSQAAFTAMLLRWLPAVDGKEPRASNWIFSLTEAKLAIGIFTDERRVFEEAVAMWRKRAPTFSYQSSDGPKPRPVGSGAAAFMDSLWFGQKTFVNGIAQETCRDIGHMLLGVGGLVYGAEMAWHQGIDLYGEERKRITDMLEFHARFLNGAAVPSWLCGGRLLLHPETPFPAGGIGSSNFEMAYNHYQREGMALPQSAIVVAKSRPAGAGGPVSKWETLTHGLLPAGLDGGIWLANRSSGPGRSRSARLRVLNMGAGSTHGAAMAAVERDGPSSRILSGLDGKSLSGAISPGSFSGSSRSGRP